MPIADVDHRAFEWMLELCVDHRAFEWMLELCVEHRAFEWMLELCVDHRAFEWMLELCVDHRAFEWMLELCVDHRAFEWMLELCVDHRAFEWMLELCVADGLLQEGVTDNESKSGQLVIAVEELQKMLKLSSQGSSARSSTDRNRFLFNPCLFCDVCVTRAESGVNGHRNHCAFNHLQSGDCLRSTLFV